MVRVLYERDYGVYVNDERGQRHHRAHAHIVHERVRVASFYPETLDFIHGQGLIPAWLLAHIAENQGLLLTRWQELNDEPA